MIGARWYFVSRSRYAYRGEVTAIENGNLAILKDNTQVIDLGDGKKKPKEEIAFPDGMRIPLEEMEMFAPEPETW